MKLLISGATGFIGKNLAKRLLGGKHEVCAVIRPSTNIENLDKRISTYIYDGNVPELISFMQKEKFDGVIHLASLFLIQHKAEDVSGLIESNVLFSTALLEASVKSSVPWFINTGTFWQHYLDKSYSPVNLYAATKQAFEDIAQYYRETSEINFVTIKLFATFGPFDTRSKVFNLWSKISKTKETLDMSPGEQLIDMTYIDNIIDGYFHMITSISKDSKRKLSGQSFTIQSDKRVTLKKLAKIFEKISNKKLNINWGGRPYSAREVMVPWSNGNKIPGFKPGISLEEGIKRTLDQSKDL
jgi:nucleoside-diphosphate-sugar epimerase